MANKTKITAPCIINDGTLINKKDMIRALETFECVNYYDFIGNKCHAKGEGIVIKVFASKDSATLIINCSVFLNVMSFEYLDFKHGKNGEAIVELFSGNRRLKLVSKDEDPRLLSKINHNTYGYPDDLDDDCCGPCPHFIRDEDLDDDE